MRPAASSVMPQTPSPGMTAVAVPQLESRFNQRKHSLDHILHRRRDPIEIYRRGEYPNIRLGQFGEQHRHIIILDASARGLEPADVIALAWVGFDLFGIEEFHLRAGLPHAIQEGIEDQRGVAFPHFGTAVDGKYFHGLILSHGILSKYTRLLFMYLYYQLLVK